MSVLVCESFIDLTNTISYSAFHDPLHNVYNNKIFERTIDAIWEAFKLSCALTIKAKRTTLFCIEYIITSDLYPFSLHKVQSVSLFINCVSSLMSVRNCCIVFACIVTLVFQLSVGVRAYVIWLSHEYLFLFFPYILKYNRLLHISTAKFSVW